MRKNSATVSTAFVQLVLLVLILLLASALYRRQPNEAVRESHQAKPGRVGAPALYPNSNDTPGAVDPRVTQENVRETICISGWTKTVRPPERFTNGIKMRMVSAKADDSSASDYELDHFIPLELGGCPDCEANLWLEPYQPEPGAHQKDRVENYLHRRVCSGAITLQQAQQQIAGDWYKVYLELPGR